MNQENPTPWILGASGALLLIIWLSALSFAAWRRIAQTYPDQPFQADTTFRASSGHIGGTLGRDERCLRVELGPTGLRVSTWRLLHRLLPPFVVPWSEIQACTQARYYLSPRAAQLQLKQLPQLVYLWSRRWRDEPLPDVIQRRWHER